MTETTSEQQSTGRVNGLRDLLGYTVQMTDPGHAEGRLEITEDHLNRGGITHGGAVATILDSAMGHAVGSLREPGKGQATATMTVTYLYPTRPGDVLIVNASVRKRGRAMMMVEGIVTRESDGKEIATGSSTFAVYDAR